MNSTMPLAEMVNNTNYAAMDYYQLMKLDLTFTWASEIIKSLLPIKKREEMDSLSSAYAAKISKTGDDQEVAMVIAEENTNDNEIQCALPEAQGDNKPVDTQNNKPVVPTRKKASVKKISVDERVIEMIQDIPLGDHINPNAPYYVCYMFKNPKGGDLMHTRTGGWNASPDVVKMLQTVEKTYMEEHKKAWTKVVGDYNIYHMPGGWVWVSYFKSTGEYKMVVPDVSELPKEIQNMFNFSDEIDKLLDENLGKKAVVPDMKEETPVEKSEANSSIKTSKKDPRCIAIIGTKDGDTRIWNSYRECERDLGVGYGTASQVISGKMKSAKGWILKKVEEPAE